MDRRHPSGEGLRVIWGKRLRGETAVSIVKQRHLTSSNSSLRPELLTAEPKQCSNLECADPRELTPLRCNNLTPGRTAVHAQHVAGSLAFLILAKRCIAVTTSYLTTDWTDKRTGDSSGGSNNDDEGSVPSLRAIGPVSDSEPILDDPDKPTPEADQSDKSNSV